VASEIPGRARYPAGRTSPLLRVRRSIATVSLSGTLEEKLGAAARAGFDGVEIFENDLITCRLRPADVRALATDLGLEIVLYQPFRDYEAVPDERLTANLRRAEHKFAVMTALGTDTLLVCSNVSETAIDDDDRAAAQLRSLAERASQHGIRVAFEALAWGRRISSYTRAFEVVSAAGHPNLGICLDSFHILSLGHDPAAIRSIPAGKIFFLQLADAPLLPMDVLRWSRHYRCFPGQGDFDLTGFMSCVLAAGYRGPWSLEVFNDVFRQADAERIARDGLRSLLALEESLAHCAQDVPGPLAGAPVSLAEPPSPARLTSYAFVELAVDGLLQQATESALQALGFSRRGRHRTKPVELWQQGGVRVLVNRSGLERGAAAHGSAAVAAIAVESTDPARSATRARALLAPAIPRSREPDEADLTAVEAPDGTFVFFCQTDTGSGSGWLGDFRPLTQERDAGPRTAGPHAPGEPLLTAVDHVALSQPFDSFDEATLFYQSVLGMLPQGSQELASPYGLVRSRAMRANGVRLALNAPLLGGSGLPETAAAQHVAFRCTDIFATARAVRSLGIPTLPVPGNYYEDLTARFDLGPGLGDALREFGVLYDRDENGGEFFHFYTVMLGRRLFFEVVQRRGGYDGYGTPNTAVRMAAQLLYTASWPLASQGNPPGASVTGQSSGPMPRLYAPTHREPFQYPS
jgi:4-hydroxyphenylpyruvate dioxygenase